MMDKQYRKLIESIKIDGENFADSAMKGVYLEQKQALDVLHNQIGKLYVDHAKDGYLKLTTTQKREITANVTNKLKTMGLSLGNSEVVTVTSILSDVFKTTYYKNLYTLESGMTVNLKFNILKDEFVNAAVKTKFKSELFSDRIWANKADMMDKLHGSIVDAMKGDVTIDKIGRQIRDRFNVTAYESQRLINTENARVQTQASYEVGKAAGVERRMFSATLDNKTSPECAEADGKVFGIDEDSGLEIPLHPNCRSAWINVPYEGWSPTNRRDNETKEIINYTNYNDWKDSKGI